eukprot:TRINITY_DN58784_c0_g1_i1.p1 TRINITY_DN58784_c0_g1~~TRINITY_DN58784_c0_g1_i1.p1  ORF type:complete len:337 (+),score=62.14 TRINITY_DN58784_c0_g1_i1:81-1091(+)
MSACDMRSWALRICRLCDPRLVRATQTPALAGQTSRTEEVTRPCVELQDYRASQLEECPVCFEAMGEACPVHKLSCGHVYHHACIQRWLRQNASCPMCKAATGAPETQEEPGFRIDLGHQEMSRIIQEIEEVFEALHQVVDPSRPLSIAGVAANICSSLGYEDEDELEEAIGGSLADFLGALPHFEVFHADPDDESAGWPKVVMHTAQVASGASSGMKTTFTVSEREDLWRVLLQGPMASVEIPEIEFAIRPQEHRRVDTIYNMICAAIFNLGDHVQKNRRQGGNICEDDIEKICEAIDSLNSLLDLAQPFTLVIVDPEGVSQLKPSEGVHVEGCA